MISRRHVRPPAAGRLAVAAVAAAVALAAVAGAAPRRRAVVQEFDGSGSPFAAAQCLEPPAPTVVPGGPWGDFLRLATSAVPSQNAIAFDAVRLRARDTVVADFDMRILPSPPGRADGLGFALLDAALHEASGPVCPEGEAEEPNFAGSVGVGFDIYRNDGPAADVGNGVERERFSNSVSVHADGALVAQADVSPHLDLASGQWLHARVLVAPGDGFSEVSVWLTPFGGRPALVVSALRVDGVEPRRVRPLFAARSGGEGAHFDLDNVRVVAVGPSESAVSFESAWAFADERAERAALVLTRVGDLNARAKVRVVAEDGGAAREADYRWRPRTVVFARGEATKVVEAELLDDDAEEADETFRLRLEPASRRTRVAGPAEAEVTIQDDESAARRGRWDPPSWWPVVPVHASLLPTGAVLFWDRFGACRRWDPVAGAVDEPAQPPFNVFCAGHAYLADGRLLVAGGHLHSGEPEHDAVGIADAAVYDPFADAWTRVPDMRGGRWYPTNTALDGGRVLVLSGSVDEELNPNLVPQVWEAGGGWRDLTAARERAPYGVDLYPRTFLAPDGTVFKAGPDRDSWFLEVHGTGAWRRGPSGVFARPRTYGPAAMYAPGKVLVAGGGNPPTATAEVIDLADAAPSWRAIAPMAFARRHANLTLLPDGTALATGGTSGPGTNNQTAPVLAAELWDPATEAWALMASARVPRLYHSVAMLLPDGRVLAAGGGQGDHATSSQNNAEIFSPAYLFRGPRPVVEGAPSEVRLGERFVVRAAGPERVARVTLVRLPSVTHAFDQNQRFVELAFEREAGGLVVSAPSRATECPEGHYMLFLLSEEGVPSVGRIVRVGS